MKWLGPQGSPKDRSCSPGPQTLTRCSTPLYRVAGLTLVPSLQAGHVHTIFQGTGGRSLCDVCPQQVSTQMVPCQVPRADADKNSGVSVPSWRLCWGFSWGDRFSGLAEREAHLPITRTACTQLRVHAPGGEAGRFLTVKPVCPGHTHPALLHGRTQPGWPSPGRTSHRQETAGLCSYCGMSPSVQTRSCWRRADRTPSLPFPRSRGRAILRLACWSQPEHRRAWRQRDPGCAVFMQGVWLQPVSSRTGTCGRTGEPSSSAGGSSWRFP